MESELADSIESLQLFLEDLGGIQRKLEDVPAPEYMVSELWEGLHGAVESLQQAISTMRGMLGNGYPLMEPVRFDYSMQTEYRDTELETNDEKNEFGEALASVLENMRSAKMDLQLINSPHTTAVALAMDNVIQLIERRILWTSRLMGGYEFLEEIVAMDIETDAAYASQLLNRWARHKRYKRLHNREGL